MVLNRRHKAGLFLALVATGLSLFLQTTIKQTLGVLLLGLALGWLLGSLNVRTLGIVACFLVCAVGLVMAVVPIRNDWESYRISAQDYDAAIAELRRAVAKASQAVGGGMPPETLPPDFFYRKRAGSKAGEKEAHYQLYDTSRLDVVEHACLGTLKFPHNMPYEERNRLIEEIKKKKCKMVEIPTSTQKWERPPDESGFLLTGIPFPNNATDEEIVSSIQAKELLPRPSFSIKAEIASHRVPFFTGSALVTLGVLGFIF